MAVYKTLARAAVVLGFFAATLCAQIRSNTITGTLRDSSGAVIPAADVALINQETNITVRTKTTAAGEFTFPYLQQGTYTLSVTVPGFAAYRERDLRLETDQTLRADVNLKVGTSQQVVEVRAQAAQLHTDSSTIEDTTQAAAIAALPNITQNPMYYAQLEQGVVPRSVSGLSQQTTWMNSFGIGFYGRMNWSAMGVNGGRAFTNDIQLDGLAVMSSGYNEAAVVPNTEALEEVRVISNDYTAEYGRGQGVVSMMTKSGTNSFHGEVNYHLRNDELNANSNYNNAFGLPKQAWKLDDFGGAIGGAIKKDKLFFFTSEHYMRFNQGVNWLFTVPTNLERAGNFGATLIPDFNGQPVPAQVFNPFSVQQLGPNLYQRAQYANAIITNPNPYALHIFSLYPQPNRTPIDAFNDDNFGTTTSKTYRKDDNNSRIDYKRGAQSFYASGGIGYGNILTGSPWGPTSLYFPAGDRQTRDFNPYAQIGDTVIFSPTLVLDLRYGVTRINMIEQGGSTSGFTDYNAWGIPSSVQAIMPVYGGTPDVLPGYNWEPLNNSTNNNKREWQTNQTVVGSLTKVYGKWTFKAGGEYRDMLAIWQDLYQLSSDINGSNFTSEYITANGTNAAQDTTAPEQGTLSPASLLAGAGVWDVQPRSVRPILSAHYIGLYSQNDWHASSRLTLNLGLRWDFQPAPAERHNRMESFNLNAMNAFGTQGAVCFPKVNCGGLWNSEYHDFQPRLGAAYQLSSNTVVRGGFGITYIPNSTGNYSSNLLYDESTFGYSTNDQPYGLTPAGVPIGQFSVNGSATGPAIIVPPVGANPSSPVAYSPGSAFITNEPNGRVMQWNFNVERRLSPTWFLSTGYVGTVGSHLQTAWLSFENLQNVPSSVLNNWHGQYLASNGTLDPSQQQIANPYQPATGPLLAFGGTMGDQTIPAYIPYLPDPLLSNLWATQENLGSSNFNALQIRLTHQFSNGLLLNAHYQWSKSLDDTSTIAEDTQYINNAGGQMGYWDLAHPHQNFKPSFSDLASQFVMSAVYDLPVGAGHRFQIQNRVGRAILGGWQTSGVWVWQDGFPTSPQGANSGGLLGPNRIPGVPIKVPKALQHWYDGKTSVTLPCGQTVTPPANTFLEYNLCAFSGQTLTTPNGSIVPDVYWDGNSAISYDDMRGPGRFNIDWSIRKTFTIRENVQLQIGADATNFLNHTQYALIPGGTINNNLGNTNTSPASGPIGIGTNYAYGTYGEQSFDPRQFVLNARIRF
jgi:hypothetical protein